MEAGGCFGRVGAWWIGREMTRGFDIVGSECNDMGVGERVWVNEVVKVMKILDW